MAQGGIDTARRLGLSREDDAAAVERAWGESGERHRRYSVKALTRLVRCAAALGGETVSSASREVGDGGTATSWATPSLPTRARSALSP